MNISVVREKLNNAGCKNLVFADYDRVVYIPTSFAMQHKEILEQLNLKEDSEDTLFRAGRHYETHSDMTAFS